MKTKIFLPYFPEGPLASSESDLSDEQYARQLLDMYDSGYKNFMDQAMGSMMDQRHGVMEVMPEKYAIENAVDDGRVDYYEFECVMNNEEDEPMSEDEFNFYANSGNMCAFFLHNVLPPKQENESEDVVELNSWLKESRNIMSDAKIDDGVKVGMLPAKDLIIEFPSVSTMMNKRWKLCGSRVIDQDNQWNFAIIVTKIEEE